MKWRRTILPQVVLLPPTMFPSHFPPWCTAGRVVHPTHQPGRTAAQKPCGLVFLYARGHGGLLVFSFMHCLESSSVWRTWIEINICPTVLHEARPRRGIDGSPALYPWPLWVSERHPCPGQRADSRCPRRAGDAHTFLDQKHPSVRRRGLFMTIPFLTRLSLTHTMWGTILCWG